MNLKTTEIASKAIWDNFVSQNGGHPLQFWGWGELKKAHGNWSVKRVLFESERSGVGVGAGGVGATGASSASAGSTGVGSAEADRKMRIAGAQILFRALPFPFKKIAYIPRGPIVLKPEFLENTLLELVKYCKSKGAFMIKIEPTWLNSAPNTKALKHLPCAISTDDTILISNTLQLDLTKSEDILLSDMTKKTRQYVRKAEKAGVVVRRAENAADLEACLEIYKDTAKRAGFPLHPDSYYLDLHKLLGDKSWLYLAEYDGEPVSFVWNVVSNEVAFELYGGMSEYGGKLRANYALKWRIIQDSKANGTKVYDMNGLLNDGISKFKLGFSPKSEALLAGTYDLPIKRIVYRLWKLAYSVRRKIRQIAHRR
jgi:lipid II:glycine glycyltransferase (peptidoglycan interpeptide bridge formation enzyme)